MPALKVCHRRWSLGSDDLFIPAILLVVLQSISLLLFCLVVGLHVATWTAGEACHVPSALSANASSQSHTKDASIQVIQMGESLPAQNLDTCPEFTYLALLAIDAVTLTSAILVDAAIVYYSSQGTIMNPKPRHAVVPFLATRYVFLLVEICMVVSTYLWWYFCSCSRYSLNSTLLLVVAACENVIVILLPLLAICAFDVSGARWYRLQRAVGAAAAAQKTAGTANRGVRVKISHTKQRLISARKAKDEYAQSWFKQFNVLFCCLGSERRNQQSTFVEVATIFGDLFGDTDLVASDLLAGLLLLRRAQKNLIKRESSKNVRILSGVPVLFDSPADDSDMQAKSVLNPRCNEEDRDFLLKLFRIFKFAHSATGWLFQSMREPARFCCCCCCHSIQIGNPSNIFNDNTCHLNTHAVLRMTGVKLDDIIFADFEAQIGETAFYVALDSEQRKVVVSVRGTLSLSDILTDLNADSAQIPEVEFDYKYRSGWLAHKGMLSAAISLKERLIDEKILDNAFEKAKKSYPGDDFQLILVGHSLGAGVAVLAGILLKNEYSNLHVYAFSPPGGLLGIQAARYTQSFVTTLVLAKDCVPRIGIRQIEALRADIVNVLKSCQKSKWSVIGQICCSKSDQEPNFETIKTMRNSVSFKFEDVSQSDFSEASDVEGHQSVPSLSPIGAIKTSHFPLHLPGTLHHIVRKWNPQSRKVELAVIRSSRNVYDHVLVSPRMLSDHMPNAVLEALEQILHQNE